MTLLNLAQLYCNPCWLLITDQRCLSVLNRGYNCFHHHQIKWWRWNSLFAPPRDHVISLIFTSIFDTNKISAYWQLMKCKPFHAYIKWNWFINCIDFNMICAHLYGSKSYLLNIQCLYIEVADALIFLTILSKISM